MLAFSMDKDEKSHPILNFIRLLVNVFFIMQYSLVTFLFFLTRFLGCFHLESIFTLLPGLTASCMLFPFNSF